MKMRIRGKSRKPHLFPEQPKIKPTAEERAKKKKEYQDRYREERKEELSQRQKAKRAAVAIPDDWMRHCSDCRLELHMADLQAKFYSTPRGKPYSKYICSTCLEKRQKFQRGLEDARKAKEQAKIQSQILAESRQIQWLIEKEHKAKARKIEQEEQKLKRQAQVEARIVYKQSDEYKEKHRKKEAAQHQRKVARDKENGLPSEISRYYKRNPGKRRQHKSNRRAAERGASGTYEPKDWEYILELCDFRCLKCSRQRAPTFILTRDHIVTIGWGSNTITNLQPYCWSCNSKKGGRHFQDNRPDWMKYLIYERAFPNLISMMNADTNHVGFLLPIHRESYPPMKTPKILWQDGMRGACVLPHWMPYTPLSSTLSRRAGLPSHPRIQRGVRVPTYRTS